MEPVKQTYDLNLNTPDHDGMRLLDDTATAINACPITNFVITIGKLLLRENQREWMDMDTAADFCRVQGIKLNGEYPSSSVLETTLRQFFPSSGEFYAPGVNVDGYDRPVGWERVFMVRAYPHTSTTNIRAEAQTQPSPTPALSTEERN